MGTLDGYTQINPSNSFSITIRPNGDISLHSDIDAAFPFLLQAAGKLIPLLKADEK